MESISKPEERSYAAERIICNAVIWGAYSIFEGLGIFEAAKANYLDVSESVLHEPEPDEQTQPD